MKAISEERSTIINGAISLAFAKLFHSKPATNFFRPTTKAKFKRYFTFVTEQGLPINVHLEYDKQWIATVSYKSKTETKSVLIKDFTILENGDNFTKDVSLIIEQDKIPFKALVTKDSQKNVVLLPENNTRITFADKVSKVFDNKMKSDTEKKSSSETNVIMAPFPGKVSFFFLFHLSLLFFLFSLLLF